MIPELVLSTAEVSAFDSDTTGISFIVPDSLTTGLDSLTGGVASSSADDETNVSGRVASLDSGTDESGMLSASSRELSGGIGELTGSAGTHSTGVVLSKPPPEVVSFGSPFPAPQDMAIIIKKETSIIEMIFFIK